MFGRTDPPQQWSVHAEFTISHPGMADPENLPQTNTEQGDNGVRMTYTWTSNNNQWTPSAAPSTSSNRSLFSDSTLAAPSKCYGFQRGNLLFTSTPPRTRPPFETRQPVQDSSGYGSDLLSPNSNSLGSSMRRPVQPYNRKCRSTCNIVLSSAANVQDEIRTPCSESNKDSAYSQCGRTQSLRCQTPTLRVDRKDNFYGCGDPWCHHLHYGDDISGRFSPVMEMCEECPSTQPSRSSLPPEVESRRDACVQTFEMIDKCTSPYMKVEDRKERKKKYGLGNRRRTEPIFQRSHTPSSITPDSLESGTKAYRKLTRSPKLSKISSTEKKDSSSDASKKPRTVHIDVYCTGTELDSSSSSSESTDNETASTPQTVFESKNVKITHKRADENQLPSVLQQPQPSPPKEEQVEKVEESDDDTSSTAYPSKLSSYSTIRDFSSSISSVPPSWTTYSMSSCTVPDDYDSVTNTSWKDTFSDIDSLLQSRSSIAQTDSLDFVPRRLYEKNPSIDETPERKDLLETPTESLHPSDSFEYADSEDRLRIKRMEELWKAKTQMKPWRSPHLERKHLLQQRKMKEYMEKRLSDKNVPKWESRESKETDSEASDDSEKGWAIVKPAKTLDAPKEEIKRAESPAKSPSALVFQQRYSLDPSLRSPFTIVPGIYTEQRAVARKFGSMVSAFRKPGHHVGPAKNPDCLCDHCQRHFENVGYRNRTRSMGEPATYNWKGMPKAASNSNTNVPHLYTDF